MEKKLIRFRSMTTLLWPISQRVRISPRSGDQKLTHAEQGTRYGCRKQDFSGYRVSQYHIIVL